MTHPPLILFLDDETILVLDELHLRQTGEVHPGTQVYQEHPDHQGHQGHPRAWPRSPVPDLGAIMAKARTGQAELDRRLGRNARRPGTASRDERTLDQLVEATRALTAESRR